MLRAASWHESVTHRANHIAEPKAFLTEHGVSPNNEHHNTTLCDRGRWGSGGLLRRDIYSSAGPEANSLVPLR